MKIKAFIIEIVNLSGLPKPIERTINYPYWLAARKAAKVGRKWNRKFNEIEEKKRLEIQKLEKKKEANKIKKEKNDLIEYNKPINVKKRLKEEKARDKDNNVVCFVKNNLKYTGETSDFVIKTKIYEIYQKINPNLDVGKIKFYKILMDSLNKDNFILDTKRDGKRCKEIFIKWKLIYKTNIV